MSTEAIETRASRRAAQEQPSSIFYIVFFAISWVIVGVLCLALMAVTVGPQLFGYESRTALTQSMQPAINPGDQLLVKRAPSYKQGDIITFYMHERGDETTETHRIIAPQGKADNKSIFMTKGDNNKIVDPEVNAGQIVGKVEHIVPKVGYFLQNDILKRNVAIALAMCILALILAPSPHRR